ncbi:putative phosphoglycerate dehydrogenase [Mrakia frigida]|uniref:putative phosphoglycerate dehydrogenase n=1 Tax=Mrakia frigida TaxID=29902 RepID=UPI003FCC194B
MSFLPTPPSEPASRHENAPKAKDSTVWIPSTWDEGATTHAQAIFGRVILRDEIPEAEALALCDGIVLRPYALTRERLLKAPKLRAIARNGVGYDSIDPEAAQELGIAVMNVPGKNSEAVAELVLTFALVLLRRVAEQDRRLRARELVTPMGANMSHSLRGKKLGIIGMGAIARRTAELFWDTFQCEIHIFSPTSSASKWTEKDTDFPRLLPHTRQSSLSDLLPLVDILSVHCPLNASTRHLIGSKELATMKPSSIVINTARGGIIEEVALEEALRSRVIGGVGCDVWEVEPPTWQKYGGLFSLPNCISMPHSGAATFEVQLHTCTQAVDQLADFLDGKGASNRVI